jgi:hypothetical protein
MGVRAFRWLLLHSPLGWINPGLYVHGRADAPRFLIESAAAEGVHWLTCAITGVLAIRLLPGEHALYGYTLLLIRIPFDVYPIALLRWNRARVRRVLRGRLPDRSTR